MSKKKFGTGLIARKSKTELWLMRVCQIKILYIFVPNLGEICLFGKKKKKSFFRKNELIQRRGSQKTVIAFPRRKRNYGTYILGDRSAGEKTRENPYRHHQKVAAAALTPFA